METETEVALALVVFKGLFLFNVGVGLDPNNFFQEFSGFAEIFKFFKYSPCHVNVALNLLINSENLY